jgi:uncharacterized protein (TIGR02246 family)
MPTFKRAFSGWGCAALVLTLFGGCGRMASRSTDTSSQSSDADLSGTIIALERATLDRWGKGDPQGFLEMYSPDVTYFDPGQDKRVDGHEAMTKLLVPLTGKIKIDRYDMVSPDVKRHGNVAVLTYNIVNYLKQPDGSEKAAARWNVTEVYREADGKWKIIHSHFSLTKPALKQAPGA